MDPVLDLLRLLGAWVAPVLPLGAMWLVLRRTARRHARGAVRSPHTRRPPGP